MSEVITLRLSAIIVNHEVRPRSSFPGMGMDKILAYNPSLKTIATITTDVKRKDPLLARTGADDNVKDASLAIKKSPDYHRGLEGLCGHNARSN